MKIYLAIGTLFLASASLFAQSSAPAQSTEHSTGMPANMQMGSAKKSKGMSGMKHHEQMQADMQMMKTQIDKMRSDAQKVQDASTKAALLDNVDMWEHFMSRMQSHMDMMMSDKPGMMHCKDHPMSPKGQTSTPKPK